MIARWLETLVEIPKNLLEKEGKDLIVRILERFDDKG